MSHKSINLKFFEISGKQVTFVYVSYSFITPLTHTYHVHVRGSRDEYDIILDHIREGINLNFTKLLGGRMEKHEGNGRVSVIDYKNCRILNLYSVLGNDIDNRAGRMENC